MGKSGKIDISRFDPTNASDDQIRLWLFAIIQAELEKDDAEIDQELIDECSDCEAFLSHSNPEITKEEYALGLANIKEKALAGQAGQANASIQAKPKKHRFMRVAVYFLAAALAIAILTVGTVAAFNSSAAWEFIMTNIKQIVGMEPGDSLDGDKVTLVKGDLVAEYDSLEEALKAGGFEGILYPTKLPEGVKIERVVQGYIGDGKYRLSFNITNEYFSYGVLNYCNSGMENWDTIETKIIHGRTYYIVYVPNSKTYQAGCYYNGFEHILKCSNYDTLINILNNLEEFR